MNEHPTEADALHEELVAYLDGELDSAAVMVVERIEEEPRILTVVAPPG